MDLAIHTLGKGTELITKEFSTKELIAEKGKFDLKIENNRMKQSNHRTMTIHRLKKRAYVYQPSLHQVLWILFKNS
ncbi:hypothetical protein LEP1GSC060_3251 [Leptospira weilii serovar Ranarum str. ICFT]|uniref:Uncharacterized protein n=1 Tax=Leptospira weilii serovar Ranarum str. ICFT TaxID=1218598 RepID=N1WLM4_9LEPT|nr:hypothetical protein [Leptospira weilii]EMY76698.1 hypothetical protein LEP1GSC060_3251 [Leptospira weilii serovar Ranarum str. ICFT]